MHPVEVLALALESRGATPDVVPEQRYRDPPAALDTKQVVAAGATLAAIGLLAAAALRWRAHSRRHTRIGGLD